MTKQAVYGFVQSVSVCDIGIPLVLKLRIMSHYFVQSSQLAELDYDAPVDHSLCRKTDTHDAVR